MLILIAGEMQSRIRQVIKYHSSGSRSMTVGRNRCVRIDAEIIRSKDDNVFVAYASYDEDDNVLQEFVNGDLAIEYFKVKKEDGSSSQKSESTSEKEAE